MAKTKHGNAKHGQFGTPEYWIWAGMKARCSNPNNRDFRDYGGRGITVCDRWKEFLNFIEDMGKKPTPEHSIERLDTNGDYKPDNCIWATKHQQARNKRNNYMVEFGGENLCLSDWSKKTGLNRKTLWDRLRSGWTISKALTQQSRQRPHG